MSTSQYTLIPITRSSTTTRAHADTTVGFSKQGDLTIILSPVFLSSRSDLAVGAKVLIGFDPETHKLLIAPVSEGANTGLRTIRPRPGFSGAGTVFIAAQNLPEGLPAFAKRAPVAWENEASGGIALKLRDVSEQQA